MKANARKFWNTSQVLDEVAGADQPSNWSVAAAIAEQGYLDQAKAHIASATVTEGAINAALGQGIVFLTRNDDPDLSERKQRKSSKKAYDAAITNWKPEGGARGATVLTLGFLDFLAGSPSLPEETSVKVLSLKEIVLSKLGSLVDQDSTYFLEDLSDSILGLRARLSVAEPGPDHNLLSTTFNDAIASLYVYALTLACGKEAVERFPCIEDLGGLNFDGIASGEIRSFSWRINADQLIPTATDGASQDFLGSAQAAFDLLDGREGPSAT